MQKDMFRKTAKLGQHHKVQRILGEGGFGYVAKCLNVETQELEAVKVVKTRHNSIKNAQEEIEMLTYLQRWDPEASHIVRFNNFFFHEEMICLSFELLDCDLRKYIWERCEFWDVPFSLSEVKHMIYQLATALDLLKAAKVIHADLKPENILVVDRDQEPPKLKLVDFGGAHFSSDADPRAIINTLCYSPPEVHLGCKYNEAVDIWALGLVAVELLTGSPLYWGQDAYDVLKGIVATQGQLPDHVLNLGEFTTTYFHQKEDSNPRWILKTPEEYEEETEYRSDKRCNTLHCLEEILVDKTGDEIELFLDLVKGMLELDYFKRLTPRQVLMHPFFADSIPQSIAPTQECAEEKPVEEPGAIWNSSCFQNKGQKDFNNGLEVPISSLPAAEEILDVHLEIPVEVQLEIPVDVHLESTSDIHAEIPDVQPNNGHSRGRFMGLIRWIGKTCRPARHRLWTRLRRFFRNDHV